MDWVLLPKGLLLGVSIAAPVGPIGVLTIRRTLASGFRIGLATGLGAATADAAYGVIAAFGLTAITAVLVEHDDAIRLVGGAMLLSLGLRGLWQVRRGARRQDLAVERTCGIRGSYLQAIALTMTNPLTILSFAGMFAGVGAVGNGADTGNSLLLVGGVGAGSAAWWLFLCTITNSFRSKLSDRAVSAINVISSGIIGAFGVAALLAAR